jgi:hypothetical protein
MAIVEFDIGYKKTGLGATNVRGRGDRTGALVNTAGHADFQEAVISGNAMVVSNAVAGVTHGTVFGTTAPISLWNPPSSGKNLVIWKAIVATVSGTLGYGFYAFGQYAQAALPAGTELTPVNALLGYPRGVGRAFTGATAVGGTPTIIRPSITYGAFAGAAAMPGVLSDFVNGEIIVTQGMAIALQGIGTAGSTPLVVHSIVYEEVDA